MNPYKYLKSVLEHPGSLQHNYLVVVHHDYLTYENVLESSMHACKHD